mmetsp:Transcript_4367/g.12829  ORF Transcript_4367/g.12829 Transcript_4367/m.12829 type:complete len:188 (+) Transcript_4367:976-1539(+)
MIITTAHAMANDAMSSTLSIQYRASLIAAACMNLICKTQGFKLIGLEKWIKKWNEEIASDTDPKYQSIVLAKEEIEEVVNQLLDMYDALQAPAQNAEPNAAAAPPPAPPAAPAEAAADSSRQVPKAEAPASRPHAEHAAAPAPSAAASAQPVIYPVDVLSNNPCMLSLRGLSLRSPHAISRSVTVVQ